MCFSYVCYWEIVSWKGSHNKLRNTRKKGQRIKWQNASVSKDKNT